MLQAIDKWHKTRPGLLIFGLLELALAYTFGSLALNSGSLWEWTLAGVLLFGSIGNLARMLKVHKK